MSIENLSRVVSELSSVSRKILEKNVKLLSSESVLQDIFGEIPNANIEDIKEILYKFSNENTVDAEKVSDEVGFFSKSLAKGKFDKQLVTEKCPFLSSVWYGDYYGSSKGVKALSELLNELMVSLKLTKPRKVVGYAVTALKASMPIEDEIKDDEEESPLKE